ncbi:MAG: type II toxin-antitoxin system VapC family toxin [Hyphomicrobiales bacterium]|nr:type II toxin-antitoxin system VapC family toxin [Hyphomicrobiales bacterium]
MSLVIDASATLPWYFQDEVSAESELIFDRVASAGAVVPAHWKLEVANGFQTALRRRRISSEYRDESLADLDSLPIDIDPETNERAWSDTLQMAVRLALTPYDAAYLELALRRRLPLATLDKDLRKAAAGAGVEIV